MKKEDCFFLGYISRKHGYKGVVKIKLETPAKYKDLAHMFIEMNGGLVPFFIDSFRLIKENIALVNFEDVGSEEDAQRLVGKEVFIPLEFIDESQQNELAALIGFEVIDSKHGSIGKVNDILNNTAQDLFQISNGYQDFLVPITEEFIQKIEGNTIYLETPEGLIDLFLE
ncbi:MAG: 16S rRNA processing protein RimM [Flavobacteriales bacterium]|nr:16S rRNA processing protein RimM [Flavobacteriales bacterium]|tara:strand:+ start:1149 stop:1658 length:510 start_codon:yes stop_codon:yes gene_type:complete